MAEHMYLDRATDEFLARRYDSALTYLDLAQDGQPDESASPIGLAWREIRQMIRDASTGAHVYA